MAAAGDRTQCPCRSEKGESEGLRQDWTRRREPESGSVKVMRAASSSGPPSSYPTHFRALRNMRIQGESSPQPSGCHEC